MEKIDYSKSISFSNKLMSIRNEIKIVFITSVLSILIIEVWLKKIVSPLPLIYFIGDIYLRICYSIVPASIFFLINQHIPKENRNVKINRYIRNKLVLTTNELSGISRNLGLENRLLGVSEEVVKIACEKINPSTPVIEGSNTFSNWHEYLKFKIKIITYQLNDVIILNSSIETELLGPIVNMLDALEKFDALNYKYVSLGKDLTNYSYWISYLFEEDEKIFKILKSPKYEVYNNTNVIEDEKNKLRLNKTTFR